MRALLVIVIIVLIGFLIYTQILHPPSEDEQDVKALRKEFDLAVNQYIRALKYTSGIGMDLVGNLEMAVARVKKVRAELLDLKTRLQDEEAQHMAAALETKINTFMKKNDLD